MFIGASGENSRQYVDIKEMISWQTKVKINFQNNTEKPVSIYSTPPEGESVLIIKDMPAGTELRDEPLICIPGQLLTIKQDDAFLADYVPDNTAQQVVDIMDLKTWFQPVEITFYNATEYRLDVYFRDSDANEIKYTGDQPLVNSKLIQPANPMSMWVIKSGDEVVAEYVTTNQKKQECKLTNEFLNSDE